jgi:hypothetical protein
MGLDEPDKKMSKSQQVPGMRLACWMSRRRSAKNHARDHRLESAVDFASMGAGVQNLLAIFQAFTEWPNDKVRAHFEGMRYGD